MGVRLSWMAFLGVLLPMYSHGAYENYNNILIGDKAAGMGGAFTAMEGDPAGCPYYNPATLSRFRGHSFSANATVYHKYDTKVGRNDMGEAALRVNQGAFKPIPAAAGSVGAFGNFAVGLSIIEPQHDYYSGEIENAQVPGGQKNTILQLNDESLWVGGNLAINLSDSQSFGVTAYYTSRDYQRSIIDQDRAGGTIKLVTEAKNFTHNSLVYILGYYNKLDTNYAIGATVRFPSLDISGRGSFFRSELDTATSTDSQTSSADNVESKTQIPGRMSFGLSYNEPKKRTYSLDLSYYMPDTYYDFGIAAVADRYEHRPVVNYAVGAEYQVKPWAALRLGAYTNFASTVEIPEDIQGQRYADHIDMIGFSANISISNSDSVAFTFGGYYTGGSGQSTQVIGQQIVRKDKSKQIFSMLVGSAYYF